MNYYEKYAEVRRQMDELELMEKALKDNILKDMQEKGKTTEDLEYGKFTYSTRKSYLYTDKIQKLEEDIKIKKIEEVEKGLAEVKETNYVAYKAK